MQSNILFDSIRKITKEKDKEFYDSLTDSEKTQYSEFMINRMCSLDDDFVVVCDIINTYIGKLPNEQIRDMMYYLYPQRNPKMKFKK